MAGKKKFGAFAGVFTPSILTILGVIMYMRLGWVVGNAGLIGTIVIILIAHVIAVSTGLSVSSVATDKKIGAGGIYYVLSRSMGIPIGGSIGITLYVGTAFSIALYLIGFAESFNGYFGLGTTINDLRISGSIALVALTALALISTSVALKAQFFILAAIIISLVSIFFGTSEFAPKAVSMFATEGSVPLEMVFAIFFPAVTGFTAGIAMSGDLKDPKKSIPVGTLLAIGTGLIVYIGLAIFIAYRVNADELKSDYNILMKIALFAPAVVAGIWGATLSSALGGILGGPRILQAMSLDRVTPKIFGKGKGKDNEPVNALMLVFIIAEAGILIGELDVIARVVSMFYLAAYGFINISYFLESWANPDFQPTFKIKRWIGLVGFVACFAVMFKLDMMAMFGAFAVIGGLYFWLQRKQIKLQSNDVWQSVWTNVVNKGLKRIDNKESKNSNWNPNIILFSGDTKQRPKLLEFSKILSGRTGMVTDFRLVTNTGATPIAKNQQSVKDELLEKLGIYGRKIEVDDPYSGIENIASSYGFTGVEPNTVMMNWSRSSSEPEKYTKMTQKLIHLDYNLLYLDYDERTHFGNYQTLDLWWRETDSNNAEMMLNISRYISQSPEWAKVKIRILFVNHNNSDNTLIKSKISNLTEKLRLDAEIKIINNGVEQKSFYKIIELQSSKTDLIILGIPNIKSDKQAEFILNTDELFETVGTTLLVKASNNFNVLDLDFVQKETATSESLARLRPLPKHKHAEINEAIIAWDQHLSDTTELLAEPAFNTLSANYFQFVKAAQKQFEKTMKSLEKNHSVNRVAREVQVFLHHLIGSSENFKSQKLPETAELLKLGITTFLTRRKTFLQNSPGTIQFIPEDKNATGFLSNKQKIKWQNILDYYIQGKINPNIRDSFYEFGVQNFFLLTQLTEGIKEEAHLFLEKISKQKELREELSQDFTSNILALFDQLLKKCSYLKTDTLSRITTFERDICIELMENLADPEFYTKLKKDRKKRKEIRLTESNISEYGSDWFRNQTLAHNQMQADFSLSNAGISVFMVNEMIKSRIARMTTTPQKNDIKSFSDAINYIDEHLKDEKLGLYSHKTLDKLADGIPHLDFNTILKNEEDKILSLSGKAIEQAHLISANSINDLDTCQNEDLEALEINLASIQNYIIQSSYLGPLQSSLLHLEKVFKENSEELYNSSNLLKHILTESITEENFPTIKSNLAEVKMQVDTCLSEITKIESSFNYNLQVHIHNTFTDLKVRAIIESIDSYSKVTLNPVIKTKFQNWIENGRRSLSKRYRRIYNFIVQRKRDVDSIKFREKHNQYLNHIQLTHLFVDTLSINEEAENELSFYYKKLYTGSHLGNVNPDFKTKEFDAAKRTITRIDNGVSGAMMVLGESLAGKTIFLESVANGLSKSEKVYITPPGKQNFDVNDLHLAFQNAFNKSGTSESILNQIPAKTILIFDDIEKWWVKAPNGNASINYLAKIIEKFGSKHYFMLACNIFSFDIIRKVSDLDQQLLATIIIPPASKTEIKEIIMNRHRTARAELWYSDHLVTETKKIDSLFYDLYNKSEGNVGVALGTWISNISKDKEGNLIITNPKSIRFPKINNPNWKILLYFFTLHGNLNEKQIKRIFADQDWVLSTLKELEKTGLIFKKTNTIYALNNSARHYVEAWLKGLKILN